MVAARALAFVLRVFALFSFMKKKSLVFLAKYEEIVLLPRFQRMSHSIFLFHVTQTNIVKPHNRYP